jgi:DNA-binding LacI/PurR family transcriptional regulator
MPTARAPTMQAVAAASGVSVMTVSRALKNNPRISAATRQRVQETARRLGYRPNPLVSVLMSQLRGSRRKQYRPTIVFLTAYPERDIWRKTQRHMLRVFHGAERRCQQLGYELEPFWMAEPGMTPQRVFRILSTRSVPGIIVAPPPEHFARFDFPWECFACSSIAFTLKDPILHRATNDHFHSIELLLQKLNELGYRRIGLSLRCLDDTREDHRWIAGLTAYQFYQPVSDRVPPFLTDAWTFERFEKWFRRHRPDVVIGLHSKMNQITWLRKMGLRIPRDVGVAFLDHAEGVDPLLSGINQNAELVGAASVDLVVEQINNNERGVPAKRKIVMIEGEWVPGATVRSRR